MRTRREQWLACGGCFVALSLTGAVMLLLAGPVGYMLVGGAVFVLLVITGWWYLQRLRATAAFRARYAPEGKDLLIVYTDSGLWSDHIDSNWIPRWGHRAVVLNRSRPWQADSVEAHLWRIMAGTAEHTPVVIVVPRHGAARVVRFFLAFRDRRSRENDVMGAEAEVERLLE